VCSSDLGDKDGILTEAAVKRLQALMEAELLDIMDEDQDPSAETGLSLPRPSFHIPPPGVPYSPPAAQSVEVPKIQQSLMTTNRTTLNKNYDSLIEKASRTHNVDPALIKSVIRVESNFNPGSTSHAGAMGLMQLMPGTARDLGVKNAYDPEENIMAGTKYLKGLLTRYRGDTKLALAAYNWGAGNVEKRPEKMPEETRNYISKVHRTYRDIRS
jgi:soluble lytic murein transglycosylase-like protein